MRRIYGRKCSLSLILDGGTSVSIPYCEETVREAVNGYFLPPALTKKTKSKFIASGRKITGCFITRLDAVCVLPLFKLFLFPRKRFDLIQDHVTVIKKYCQVFCKGFSLYAENEKAFYLKCEIAGDSLSSAFKIQDKCSPWNKEETFIFYGRNVFIDDCKASLIYRIELKGNLESNSGYELKLYSPLSVEFVPTLENINKVSVSLNLRKNLYIEFHNLIPSHDLCDINCGDSILAMRRFFISGNICIIQKDAENTVELVI